MNMHGSRLLGVLFWLTYVIAALACWLTTFEVFSKSDSQAVAALAAGSIDGVLALTLYIMGRTGHQEQKTTALVGTIIFGLFSGFAQVVHRFDGLGLAMPESMKIVSLFLLPAATTGGLVLLGVIKYFGNAGNRGQGGGGGGNKQNNNQNNNQNSNQNRGGGGGGEWQVQSPQSMSQHAPSGSQHAQGPRSPQIPAGSRQPEVRVQGLMDPARAPNPRSTGSNGADKNRAFENNVSSGPTLMDRFMLGQDEPDYPLTPRA